MQLNCRPKLQLPQKSSYKKQKQNSPKLCTGGAWELINHHSCPSSPKNSTSDSCTDALYAAITTVHSQRRALLLYSVQYCESDAVVETSTVGISRAVSCSGCCDCSTRIRFVSNCCCLGFAFTSTCAPVT